VLVAANLVPLAGVLFWGWDAFALIALFWRLPLRDVHRDPRRVRVRHAGREALRRAGPRRARARRARGCGLRLWLPVAVLVASHLFSFGWNYLYRGEFRRAKLSELMSRPYVRVVVLHIAIILGGIGAVALGSPLWALLVLLAMKIGLDLKAHVDEHSKA